MMTHPDTWSRLMPRNDWDLEAQSYTEGCPPEDQAEYQA
jgi:hypothetical protein